MANNDPVNVTVGNSGRKVHRAYLAHNGQASTVCGAERRGIGVTHTRRTDRPVDCLACSPARVTETPAVEAPAATIAEQAAELAEARRTSTEQATSYAAHVAEVTAAVGQVADVDLADLADALRGTPAPVAEVEVPATCTPAYYTTPRRPAPVDDPAELELEAAARRRQLDAAIVEDMLTGDVDPYAAEAPARRDHYRAEAPVDLAGTLNSLARHGRVTPLNARRAFVKTPDGRLLVAEVVTTPRTRPTAPGRFRQLAIDPASADENGAQLDLLELAAEAEATR